MGQQSWSGKATLDRAGWRGRFNDAVATAAGKLRPHVANHLKALGDVLQLLRHVVAELAQLAATIRTAVAVRKVRDNFARKMFRKRLTSRFRLRSFNRCHPLNRSFHLGLRGLQFFQMEFELFELNNDLLALTPEDRAPQLLDDELQMRDLLVAGTQLLAPRGERLAVFIEFRVQLLECLVLRGERRALFSQLVVPVDEQRLQRFDVELIEIRQLSNNYERSMP